MQSADDERPTNDQFLQQLAPKLVAFLANPVPIAVEETVTEKSTGLSQDDPVFATITAAIQAQESLAFLLAGPSGTSKTRYARQLALGLTEDDSKRTLFLRFSTIKIAVR